MPVRRARAEEAGEVAGVWLRSRAASVPEIPPPVHAEDEVRGWFRDVVLPERDVWVVDEGDVVVAVLVLDGEWIDQLYVEPGHTGCGIGSQLVDLAKRQRPSMLKLWTFEANVRAQRFYEHHGFVVTGSTAGENEEGIPDVRYEWSPTATSAGPSVDNTIGAEKRPCSKVLLVDEAQRVLLFSGVDRTKPDIRPWWFPVGGRLEGSETPQDAAIRETREETGLVVSDPGPIVFTLRFTWDFEGHVYDQEEWYFLVRTSRFELSSHEWTVTERATIRDHRWWSIDELRTTTDTVFPEHLPDQLKHLLES